MPHANPTANKTGSNDAATIRRLADMVCEASWQAGLQGIDAMLSIATQGKGDWVAAASRAETAAAQILGRAELMQQEIDRFSAVTQNCKR